MSEIKYKKAAQVIVKAGQFPFPINDTLIDILKLAVGEEDLDFVMAFRKTTTQTMEQLKESSKMSEEEILRHAEKLAKVGLIFNQPNSQGVMIYRIMPLVMVGLFEYLFMKKLEHTEKEMAIAELFSKLFAELKNFVQGGYDTIVPIYQKMRPYDRTIPILDKNVNGEDVKISINESIEVPEEQILTTQNIEEIIDTFNLKKLLSKYGSDKDYNVK